MDNQNLLMWNLIVGFAAPLVISVINQPQWSKKLKVLVMVVVSVVAGFVTSYFTGDFVSKDIVSSILITSVAAITAYQGIFKPSGVSAKIEEGTSKHEDIYVNEPLG